MTDAQALELNPASTALVVIDLQKGILARPAEPHSSADVLKNAVRMADAMRAKGSFIVLVRVAFSPDFRDALRPPSDEPGWARGGAPPTDWADLAPEIGPRAGDHVVTKRQWGAFHGTDLDLQLRRRGISAIVLCGIATCFGVESTARGAHERGYSQVFAEDAMSTLSAAEHQHTVTRIFPRLGRVR
ncbi:MAG: hydrolase [Candidatus Eiseniibacteriota bacterium]